MVQGKEARLSTRSGVGGKKMKSAAGVSRPSSSFPSKEQVGDPNFASECPDSDPFLGPRRVRLDHRRNYSEGRIIFLPWIAIFLVWP